jgi:hypothetical protein
MVPISAVEFNPGQIPPVNAFWSITMYSSKSEQFVDNPINRYNIGNTLKV